METFIFFLLEYTYIVVIFLGMQLNFVIFQTYINWRLNDESWTLSSCSAHLFFIDAFSCCLWQQKFFSLFVWKFSTLLKWMIKQRATDIKVDLSFWLMKLFICEFIWMLLFFVVSLYFCCLYIISKRITFMKT